MQELENQDKNTINTLQQLQVWMLSICDTLVCFILYKQHSDVVCESYITFLKKIRKINLHKGASN